MAFPAGTTPLSVRHCCSAAHRRCFGLTGRILLVLLFVLAACTGFLRTASAQEVEPDAVAPTRDLLFEAAIHQKLTDRDPAAAELFRQATADYDAGDLDGALSGYLQVLELVPDAPDALRRLSYVELARGELAAAIAYARQSLAVEESPYAHEALARVLLETAEPADIKEAYEHAKLAVAMLPDDARTLHLLVWAAAEAGDLRTSQQAADTLVALLPDDPWAHYLASLTAADRNQWEKAEQELLQARALGLTAEYVDEATANEIAFYAPFLRWERRGAYAVGAWLLGLLALTAAGIVLSRWSLHAVERSREHGGFEPSRTECIVRAAYRAVVTAASVYYFLSLPMLVLSLVMLLGALAYAWWVLAMVPNYLALLLAGVGVSTLLAVLRGMLRGAHPQGDGRRLVYSDAPGLWDLAAEAARRVDTRPVDELYVVSGATIFVMEVGGLWRRLCNRQTRCLYVGLGLLPGMTRRQLGAILAHEYAHFLNQDVSSFGFASRVHAALDRLAGTLAVGNHAIWLNPAWLFVSTFYRLFLRLTAGASQLHEYLADRRAAAAYGATDFVDALTHILRQGIAFDLQVDREVTRAIADEQKVWNLYELAPLAAGGGLEELEERMQAAITKATEINDSHPSYRDRRRMLQHLAGSTNPPERAMLDGEPAWSLFNDVQELQAEMTALYQAIVDDTIAYNQTLNAEEE